MVSAEKITNLCNQTIAKYGDQMAGYYLDWEVKEVPNSRAPNGVVYELVPIIAVEMKW